MLFHHKIGDMSLSPQAIVLRVLQENQITHAGGEGTIIVDAPVISATNNDLQVLTVKG